ncbi:MAG TPA: DsrE family protein [Cyclobacteriaceae bacterium]
MKNLVTVAVFSILATVAAFGQEASSKKIVFDVTSADPAVQEMAIRHISMMAESYPGIQLELVVYGGALPMYMKEKSTISDKLAELAKNQNITFAACHGTMKRHNVDVSQLLPGVKVVPDAIIEIVSKQGEGWGYIKEVPY